MPYFDIIWTEEIVRHLAEHGISPQDFEDVVRNPASKGLSRSTGLPVVWGHTRHGRYIMAVYEQLDPLTVLPVTAYEVSEPR
jgi:hypothetical protein